MTNDVQKWKGRQQSGGSCGILHYSRARTNKNSAVPYCNGKKMRC